MFKRAAWPGCTTSASCISTSSRPTFWCNSPLSCLLLLFSFVWLIGLAAVRFDGSLQSRRLWLGAIQVRGWLRAGCVCVTVVVVLLRESAETFLFCRISISPGACGGTPLYSAPEVLKKEDFTDKCDVYRSVGRARWSVAGALTCAAASALR